jgi:hypothetical protein
MRLKNDPNSALGIREAARLGYNICQGINKANANPHTKRADREVRAITRKLEMYRSPEALAFALAHKR